MGMKFLVKICCITSLVRSWDKSFTDIKICRNLECYIFFPRSDGAFCNMRFFNNSFIY